MPTCSQVTSLKNRFLRLFLKKSSSSQPPQYRSHRPATKYEVLLATVLLEFCIRNQDIFGEGLNILISTLCVCADGFVSLELLTNFEKFFLKPSSPIPFSMIGQCSLVQTSHWLQGKCTAQELTCRRGLLEAGYGKEIHICK